MFNSVNNQYYWHVHHDTVLEKLNRPVQDRIDYIKLHKAEDEIPIRLRLLRRAKGVSKVYKAFEVESNNTMPMPNESYMEQFQRLSRKYFEQLHKEQCLPDCPWDWEQGTIFPEAH